MPIRSYQNKTFPEFTTKESGDEYDVSEAKAEEEDAKAAEINDEAKAKPLAKRKRTRKVSES